jgi:hypothetical protein
MFAASKSGKSSAGGGGTTDPYFPYVPLLLETTSTNGQQNNTFLDSSSNTFTITRNGTPTQGSITPYWPNGQWSNYFNGSADYLSSTITAVSPSIAVFECWLYNLVLESTGTGNHYIQVDGAQTNYLISNNTTGAVRFLCRNDSGTTIFDLISATGVLKINQWQYVVGIRNATTASVYVDGARVATSSASASTSTGTTLRIGSNLGTARFLNGYISNVRIQSGTLPSGYDPTSTTIAVPTTPLAAVTGTLVLTSQSNRFQDNSTNNFTITVNGTPRVQAFQPFSPTASYTTALYGGSGYFNGSTDYLTYNQTFALGTNDFTLEFWLYVPVNPVYPTNYWLWGWRNGSDNCPAIYLNALSGGGNNLIFTGNTGFLSNPSSFPINSWTHIAIVRSGLGANNLKMYVNGVQAAQSSSTQSFTYTGTQPVGANASGNGSLYPSNVYFSNFRIVNGTAVYTAAFTPPTVPLTAITNTSLLLNYTNAGIYDAAVQNNAITVGDAQSSTTQSKWSPTSMKFDGTGDWLTAIDSPQLQIGTGDFTIDGWVYLSAISVAYGIISKGTATTGWSVNVTALNKLQFSYTASVLTGTTSLATGTWYYFAVVRSGSATGNLKIYINGAVEATSGGAVTDNFNQTDILYVGASRTGTTPLNGYLQDVRITKYARTITTPTAAFPTR